LHCRGIAVRGLLISNSTQFGRGYLDHCADAIVLTLGPSVRRVLFVPYAAFDRDAYAAAVGPRFEKMGFGLDSIHDAPGGPVAAVMRADAFFVGGGNTFRLVDALWREGLIEPIRQRVRADAPYVGASAGSNVACPSIRTTNDMPIIEPPTFEALGLVPFQINPHYQEPQPGSTHMGETRATRIAEFHEENDLPVVGLREGAWLAVDGAAVTLGGSAGARLFRRGQPASEFGAGARLDFLLEGTPA
jgi:dipeptidase E